MKTIRIAHCFFVTIFLISSLSVFSVTAQEIEFASSPNPVGSGARALGMGGAFIAVADDATAASWNPAGLIQLETPELSIVGAAYYRSEDNTFGGHPEADGSQSVAEGNLNYLSGVCPFTMLDRNMVVALTYQHLYDFNRSWQFKYLHREGDLFFDRLVDYNQEGGLSAIGLSYTVQIVPALSLGLTMNVWEDALGSNNWQQNTYFTATGKFGSSSLNENFRNKDEYSFSGHNYNLGILWRITEAFTLGIVYKTPFTADIEHNSSRNQRITTTDSPQPLWDVNTNDSYDEELDMPASYGIGIAYGFNDNLTGSFDLYRTEWGDMIYTDHDGVKTSAISGLSENSSEIDSTIQIRTGIEYLIVQPSYLIPVRAGVFYDPAPSEGNSDDFYGFSLGSGFAKDNYVFDVGYQFRYGDDVGSAIFKGGDLEQNVQEHTLYVSLIYYL